MATDIIHGSHLGALYVSEESAFGTTGTERRVFPVADSPEVTLDQAELERPQLHVNPWDYQNPVFGLKSSSGKFSHYLQPPATFNNTGATPDTDAAAPLRLLLRCALGGESIAAGSDVDGAGVSATAFSVTATQGARMPDGQLIAVADATDGFQACAVRTRSTDALTVWPALTGTPAGGEDIANAMTFYPSVTNTRSVSLGLATAQNSARQWRVNGACIRGVTFKVARGELLAADFEFMGATWTGPSDLSLSVAQASDPMYAPLSTRGMLCYLQASATTTRTNLVIDSAEVKINTGLSLVESLTGGIEGKRAVMRTDGLNEAFCEVTLTAPLDTNFESWWQARTALSLMLVVPFDAGAAERRFVIFHVGSCVIVGKPKSAKGAANLDKVTFTVRSKRNATTTATTELAKAPFTIGLI